MSAVIRWEDPPLPLRVRGRPAHMPWAKACQELKRRPGRWALIAIVENSRASAQYALMLRTGRLGGAGLGVEAVARTVDGEHRVYARWVGEPS